MSLDYSLHNGDRLQTCSASSPVIDNERSDIDGPDGSPAREISSQHGRSSLAWKFSPPMCSGGIPGNVVEVEAVMECDSLEVGGHSPSSLAVLPAPPPPPPPPPLPPTLRPFLGGAAGVAGTGQFVGHTTYDLHKHHTPTADNRQHKMTEKSFLDEIASVGQSKLRSTKRPRSPGGTPIKTPAKAGAAASDKIQQALLSKFKNLHSTPIRQQKSQRDANDPMDFSNQWSDVNSFEDPDFTSDDLTSGMLQVSSPNISQGFSPSSSKISTPKPGKGASSSGVLKSGKSMGKKKKKTAKGHGVSPNASRTSTAV